jgi:hypothetical protein
MAFRRGLQKMEKETTRTHIPLFVELRNELWQDEEDALHTVPREHHNLLQLKLILNSGKLK